MKSLTLVVAFLMCGCMAHVQQERLSTFFSTPKTYHDIVMELGPHGEVVDTKHTSIFVWYGGQRSVSIGHAFSPYTAIAVSKRSGWRLSVSFSKASGQITDWRFHTY
jgi:hypothetical protein